MKVSIKTELANYILDAINDDVINNQNRDDWHNDLFNMDYYIIGYYDAGQWLIKHNLAIFGAIGVCQEYEKNTFGEQLKVYNNAETTVNMLVYIYGEELLNELDCETIEELAESLENI
jgi:hypothetical protein